MLGPFHNRLGERLDHELVGDARADELVVVGHGVTANLERPWLVALSAALAEAGIASLRISFSGNGRSEGRFEDSTVTKEVADLGSVLDALPERRITYVGHSMGGAVGVLRAASDERIRALVSLAGMVHTRDFVERKFGDLEPGRDVMWEKPECPLSRAFVDDLTAIGDVLPQAAQVRVPWLLVHGTEDTVVPVRDSREVRDAAGGRPELVELEGVDHVFTGDATRAMCEAVVAWVRGTRGSL
jgi:pimeloyl-ACP methyl ester carboxylesterase